MILFHSGIEIFSGGFIGVDIFFVLSGYLITGVILIKLENKTFSFCDFYAKRIKRLIPPVIIVKIFCLITGYYFMNPYQFFTLVDQAFYSTILLSNFFLYKNSDYFSLTTLENPLMHTWSLSLEEQFYLIFPLILVFLYLKFNKEKIFFLSSLFVIILLLAQFGGNFTFVKPFLEEELFFFNQPGFATYFMPIGRFFEFLAGSISYLLQSKLKKFSLSHVFLSYLGIFLIFLSLIFCDENSNFPNLLTLMPISGTVLLIIYYRNESSQINFLTLKPFMYIGTISYSLYLWHQPLFAFYRINFNSEIPIFVIIVIIIISFILSHFSNKFIESKVKKSKFENKKIIFIYLASVFLLISVLYHLKSITFQNNYKIEYQNKVLSKNLNLVIDVEKEKKRFEKISLEKNLNLTKNYSKQKILILGDSMSTNWIDAINQNKNLYNKNYEFNNLILDEDCFKFLKSNKYLSKQCKNFVEKFLNDLSINNYDSIFILLQWTKKSKIFLGDLLRYFKNFDSEIYLVGNAKFQNVAKIGYDFAIKDNINNKNLAKEFFTKADKKTIFYNSEVEKLTLNNDLNYIDEYDFYCDGNTCQLFDDELNLFMWDQDHLTEYGSNFLGKKLINFFKKK